MLKNKYIFVIIFLISNSLLSAQSSKISLLRVVEPKNKYYLLSKSVVIKYYTFLDSTKFLASLPLPVEAKLDLWRKFKIGIPSMNWKIGDFQHAHIIDAQSNYTWVYDFLERMKHDSSNVDSDSSGYRRLERNWQKLPPRKRSLIRFSQPIFVYDYQYAFLFKSIVCGKVCQYDYMELYQKVNEKKWNLIYSHLMGVK